MFDCAFKAAKGSRSIHYMGHLRMMGAVQPFISGTNLQNCQYARSCYGGGDRAHILKPETGTQGGGDLP